MTDTVLDIRNLSKRYRLGGDRAVDRTLRETISGAAASMAHRLRGERGGKEFWALRGVSFSVTRGEVVGVVGRNGAGKSTLLKVLSRITDPTEGYADITGRVGSLLEVGTGFHPELTGRENIYLNGAILGMRAADTRRNFDAIVDFAEVGPFLDTPVKHYSSGMYVRLAFAVAAHLQPDILIVDEVLAVGDAAFQHKCLGKMGDAARSGRTVLFVSHNMGAVRSLCTRAVLLERGQLVADGKPAEIVSRYLAGGDRLAEHDGVVTLDSRASCAEMSITRVRLLDTSGTPGAVFEADKPVSVAVDYTVHTPLRGVRINLQLHTGEAVLVFTTTDHAAQPQRLAPGRYTSVCEVPGALLNLGTYTLTVSSGIPGVRRLVPAVEGIRLTIRGAGNQNSVFPEHWPGVVCPRVNWTVRPQDDGELKLAS